MTTYARRVRAFLLVRGMPEKDPQTYSGLSFLLFAALASWGALVKYMQTLRHGRRFDWRELAIDLFGAPFVGVVVGLACSALGMPMVGVCACCGLAGHMGPRVLGLIVDRALSR